MRAIELDTDTDWVHDGVFAPSTPAGLASDVKSTLLFPDMTGDTTRNVMSWCARDFITMSAAS